MALPSTVQRTLVLAAHPDDDVLAAGGLIQRVLAARGEIRIVFVTDGENNPWPQRLIDRKFFLEAGDRSRWGAMRRREAICSLARLGIGERCATFLGFPDQGIAKLARRGDTRLRDALRAIVEEFEPTLLLTPSSFDRHPDHRAISYFAHRAAPDATIATYVVHGSTPAGRVAFRIELTDDEQRRKREAIECHVSQLALSRERFLSYARTNETFLAPEFDRVRVESLAREKITAWLHAAHVFFGIPPRLDSGVAPAAEIPESARHMMEHRL
ncbi:MAG TPA: PIG-L family deacetylase [Thermoanaerobaculia bacterium]|nr:PIG-L family deacetylase [Thermoanaerobaculia bacterium]